MPEQSACAKTLSERIHDLENELITVRDEYEREIEEKLRQINKIKAQSLGLVYDESGEKSKKPLKISRRRIRKKFSIVAASTTEETMMQS